MAKFAGVIGFEETVETSPGVYSENIVERLYYGDVIKNYRRLENSGEVNDNVTLSNEISVVCDEYAYRNYVLARYVEFMGAKWKITSISVQHPRLVLTVGGIYNA